MQFIFQPLTKEDLPLLVRWMAQPYVSQWWKEPATLEFVEKEYGTTIDKGDPTNVYIVKIGDRSMGMIMSYMVADYAEHAESVRLDRSVGVDLFIGESDLTGKGYGSAMLEQFRSTILHDGYPNADWLVADPEAENIASIRAFEKAGYHKGNIVPGEHGPEQLMIRRI
jgi:aminoglycoside 6'-N-acetyltransferase